MFHKWRLVRVQPYTYDGFVDDLDPYSLKTATLKATKLYYTCAKKNCHKTKIKSLDGYWTKEELDG